MGKWYIGPSPKTNPEIMKRLLEGKATPEEKRGIFDDLDPEIYKKVMEELWRQVQEQSSAFRFFGVDWATTDRESAATWAFYTNDEPASKDYADISFDYVEVPRRAADLVLEGEYRVL